MADTLRDKFPPIYRHLLGEVFDQKEVVEDRATCDNCAMCDHGQNLAVHVDFFHPETKCCTYHPQMPNFLVGAILADDAPDMAEGKRRVREVIASRVGTTPQWISPPRKIKLLMAASQEAFGRSKVLQCPYYDHASGGLCTVWRHRENICSTYFCKYSAGKRGWDFWRAVKAYMGQVEVLLSFWAMKQVEPAMDEVVKDKIRLSLEDLEDRGPKASEYAEIWKGWVGREEEFYVACHERVKRLSRAELANGVDRHAATKERLDLLVDRYRDIGSQTIPARLIRNPKMKERAIEDGVVVTTYNPFDSFKLDRDLFDILGELQAGLSLEKNLARLLEEHGAELEPDLLQYLVTHGVLVTPEEGASNEGTSLPGSIAAATTTPATTSTPAPDPRTGRAPSKLKKTDRKHRR